MGNQLCDDECDMVGLACAAPGFMSARWSGSSESLKACRTVKASLQSSASYLKLQYVLSLPDIVYKKL